MLKRGVREVHHHQRGGRANEALREGVIMSHVLLLITA